jgi:hypothetical protein
MHRKSGQRFGAGCGALFFVVSLVTFLLRQDGGGQSLSSASGEALAAILLCCFIGAVWGRARLEEQDSANIAGERALVSSHQVGMVGALVPAALLLVAGFALVEAAHPQSIVLRPSAIARMLASLPTALFVGIVAWNSLERGFGVLVGWFGLVVAVAQMVRVAGLSSMDSELVSKVSLVGPLAVLPALASALFGLWVLVTSIFLWRDAAEDS